MNRFKPYDLYSHPKMNTLKELLYYCAEKHGSKTAFAYQKRKTTIEVSFTRFLAHVEFLGTYLFSQGHRGCHIAVFGENSYQWILTHFAVTCGGNVIVPIDKDLEGDNVSELLRDSDCSVLVYSDTYEDIVREVQEKIPALTYINMKELEGYIEAGRELIAQGQRDYIDAVVGKEDLASIVFTSGTTGKSKGVMLSHGNFAADSCSACCHVSVSGSSILLLPLHHTFGLVAAVFSEMMYGYPIYINSSYKRLLQDFQNGKPQNFFAVPLVAETLYKSIWTTARKQNKDKALKFLVRISNILRKVDIDLRKTLFKSVIEAFGGKLEQIVCGGAPLSEELVNNFDSFGITVLNGYGITECSPIVAVNRNKCNVVGSVGLPLPCNQVKIAEDGEILVKGENVMRGYYRNKAESDNVLVDGWFKTGDMGRIDQYGALHITGRIKNLIILGNGENIPAEAIEQELYTLDYVHECIAYGKDNMIVVEFYLDPEFPQGREQIHTDIQRINQHLPLSRNIGKIVIRDAEFPKTTTNKIKRNYGG